MTVSARTAFFAWPAVAVLAAAAAGCSTGRVTTNTPPPAAAPVRSAAPADMAGRWALTGMGATCAANLTVSAAPGEGAVRPEGGCGGSFYTTRKWTFEDNALFLRDHTGKPLARLTLQGAGRFEGETTAGGQHVSLVR